MGDSWCHGAGALHIHSSKMQEATDLPPVSPTPAKAAPQRGWLHWGIIVGALYLVVLVVITVPVIYASFAKLDGSSPIPWDVYAAWQYWAIIGLILLGQFLLLRVPVRLAMKRPVSRSSVWLPIIVSGFWFAVLVIGLGFTLMELFKIDAQAWPLLALGAALASWVGWTIVFARMTRSGDPKQMVEQQSQWMLRGSILELLIAVPSHIVVRGRADCCAGIFTFVGITTGVSVMLLAFGPAVFFLYYARWQRLKKAA